MFVYGDVVMLRIGRYWPWKTVTVSSHLHMLVRPLLLHRVALVLFDCTFRKNSGNLREFFGQKVYRPPWQKISRTPMMIYLFKHDLNWTTSRKSNFRIVCGFFLYSELKERLNWIQVGKISYFNYSFFGFLEICNSQRKITFPERVLIKPALVNVYLK